MMNPRSESVTLQKGLKIASITAIEGSSICGLGEVVAEAATKEPHVVLQSKRELLWEAVEGSSKELTPSEKNK